MNAGVLVALLATVLTLGLISTALGWRLRRLGARLESLTLPLHELRGALGALELGLSLLERSHGLCEEMSECVDSLRHSLERATLGARDIDALRRNERAAADARDQVEFNTLVLRSARAWSLLADSHDASLDVDWRAGPVQVVGHAKRLQQALDNLIANALEHGGGRVVVEGERRGPVVRVLVSDGGHGLPHHVAGRLSANGQGPASRAKGGPARGHGLSIADEVARRHGGRLGVGRGRNGPGLVLELPATSGGEGSPRRAASREVRARVADAASKAA